MQDILEQSLRTMLSENDFVIPTSSFVEWLKEHHGLDISSKEARVWLDAHENAIRQKAGVGTLGAPAEYDPLSSN